MTKEQFAEQLLEVIEALTKKVTSIQNQVNKIEQNNTYLQNRINQLDSFTKI